MYTRVTFFFLFLQGTHNNINFEKKNSTPLTQSTKKGIDKRGLPERVTEIDFALRTETDDDDDDDVPETLPTKEPVLLCWLSITHSTESASKSTWKIILRTQHTHTHNRNTQIYWITNLSFLVFGSKSDDLGYTQNTRTLTHYTYVHTHARHVPAAVTINTNKRTFVIRFIGAIVASLADE